jgi:2,4-dienoyl-CoA reductase-like NADH-dependent reductase (Old Yellow Enzyme family)/thioredoxin reductase
MKLLSPITVAGVELRNRVIMAPMATGFGLNTEAATAFYAERAKGGVAAIILPAVQVDVFQSEKFFAGIQQHVVETVHKQGAKVGVQLWHGNQYPTVPQEGITQKRVAPSPGSPAAFRGLLPFLGEKESFCSELSKEEIQSIQRNYINAAIRAREAGFDFVEVHGCHGITLPHQFLSPLDNRRSDIYGGDLQGRMRFGLELASGLRSALGEGYPLFWRLSAEEGLPGGFALQEGIQNAVELARHGVDVLDVSYGHEHSDESYTVRAVSFSPEGHDSEGLFIPMARAVKRHVFVPVIGVGAIRSPDIAERVISEGSFDLLAIGKQLIADPHWVNKVATGDWDEIVPCLGCNYCLTMFLGGKRIKCSVNPFVGREREWETKLTTKPKKVFVVGGGPAGMEACLVSNSRGHKVTLFEKDVVLGGQLIASGASSAKNRINRFRQYLVTQLQKSEVDLRCGVEFNSEMIDQDTPDVLIVATGAWPLIPDIPGIDRENVVLALDVLLGKCEVGKEVVILGGGLTGCDVAEVLADKGKKATIIEELDTIVPSETHVQRISLKSRLASKGVTWLSGVKCEEVTDEGTAITDGRGKRKVIEADTIVVAVGLESRRTLAAQLTGKVSALYTVGDCVTPRRIVDAMEEGARIGLEL